MKQAIFFLALIGGLVITALTSLIGFASFIYKVWHGQDYMESFQLFSLSAILCITSVTAYVVIRTLTNTEVLADVLQKYFEFQLEKVEGKQQVPNIQNMLQNLFSGGLHGVVASGSISVSSIDEDGNETSLGNKSFQNTSEFIKYRNELLSKAFGFKQTDIIKKLEDMSIEELMSEEKKAVDSQSFELAAAIRDAIQEKNKKS